MNGMDGRFSPEQEGQLAATRHRRPRRLARRELLVDGAFAGAFLAAAFALAALVPAERPLELGVAAAFVAAFALATTIEFHTGTCYTMPSQLVFVPMLFALPAPAVPLLVATALMLGKAPRIATGRLGPGRWIVGLADSWFSLAPAAILAVAGATEPTWSDWPLYVAAFGAQFVSDAAVSALRTWACLGVAPTLVLREEQWIQRVDALLTPVGLLAAVAAADSGYGGLLVMPLVVLLGIFARERDARIDNQLELERAYRGTALLLGDVIENDDAYTGQHTRGVVGLAMAVANELRVDELTLRQCEFGALLHDIGKLRVPNDIINKPGPLDEAEWAIMRTHTIAGQLMLERVGGMLATVGTVVRASHERWDGAGYPDGLRGEEIPLAARIVSACDAYNAMTTDRAYRRAFTVEVARAELQAAAGAQLDPEVVAALLRVIVTRTPVQTHTPPPLGSGDAVELPAA